MTTSAAPRPNDAPRAGGPPLAIAVLGANGRMGRAVVRLAHEAGMKVVAAIGAADEGLDVGELAGVGAIGTPLTKELSFGGADILVDFSSPAIAAQAFAACAKAGVAVASGTTGLDEEALAALEDASRSVPVLWEPNMSVGVHVLSTLVAKAIAALGPAYDIEIVETHHRNKVDAPSGTALRLAEVARAAIEKGARPTAQLVTGREGKPGARSAEEIGVLALRGGDVIGDHTVFLLGDGERLELTHRASSRDLFARGALRAAAWLAGKSPARYHLLDILGPGSSA